MAELSFRLFRPKASLDEVDEDPVGAHLSRLRNRPYSPRDDGWQERLRRTEVARFIFRLTRKPAQYAIISLAEGHPKSMAQVLVRDLTVDIVARLKARAKRHGRSLQTELKEILETASRHSMVETRAVAARIRRQLAGRAHSDSVDLLAEDRSR